MCLMAKGAIVYVMAAPIPSTGYGLQINEYSQVFDDKVICENYVLGVEKFSCYPLQLWICPSKPARK